MIFPKNSDLISKPSNSSSIEVFRLHELSCFKFLISTRSTEKSCRDTLHLSIPAKQDFDEKTSNILFSLLIFSSKHLCFSSGVNFLLAILLSSFHIVF